MPQASRRGNEPVHGQHVLDAENLPKDSVKLGKFPVGCVSKALISFECSKSSKAPFLAARNRRRKTKEMDEGAIIPKGVNFIAGTLNEESLRIEMVEKTQAFLDLENETQSQRQSDEIEFNRQKVTLRTSTPEQISVVVESSLPSGSPTRVSRAELWTSQTNAAPYDNGNMATKQVADICIVMGSSTLPSLAVHVPQSESSSASSRNSSFYSRIMVTEGIAEEKNLTNPFRFARAELFDVDSETEGKLLKKGKRKIGMPRGGETSVPYPIRSSEITEETSLSTNPIPLPETELSTSPPKAADGEIRDRSSRLCLAAVKGDWETAKSIIENDRNLVRAGLTRERDTVFHIAVTGKCSDFIRKLVEFLEPDEMLTVNINNDTGLHIAAASGMLEVARLIDVEKNRKLLLVRGKDGLIPLALAIRGGHREMVDYLYGCTDLDDPADEEYITLVLDSLSSNLYVTALKLVDRRKTMAYERDKTGKTALHVLAQKAPEVATVGYTLQIIREILYIAALKAVDRRTNRVRPRGSPAYILASALLEILVEILYHLSTLYLKAYFSASKRADQSPDWEQVLLRILDLVMDIASEEITDLMRTPSSVIFDAAMSGNIQFLGLLLRRYPELLWEKDEKGRSVFHVAILYRQEKVFNLIYNTGAVRDYLVGIEDSDGNNMLHLAGMSSENKDKLGGLRATHQMQREILWFKEVEKIARPDQKNKKNSKGMTPRELFIAEHSQLLQEGEEAIKETAKSCMVVATLIAGVVFAASLKFQQSRLFAVLNTVALCTSTSSIVVSLSILTSSCSQSEFDDSLSTKLMIAVDALFLAITTMLAAFGVAMIVIFDFRPITFGVSIIILVVFPVFFLRFHRDVVLDLILSYLWSQSLFKPSAHKIFD